MVLAPGAACSLDVLLFKAGTPRRRRGRWRRCSCGKVHDHSTIDDEAISAAAADALVARGGEKWCHLARIAVA